VTVVLGDNVIFDDVSSYVRSFSGGAMAFFNRVRDPRRSGVPAFEGEKPVAIEEKPSHPKSDYAQVASTRRISRRELEVSSAHVVRL